MFQARKKVDSSMVTIFAVTEDVVFNVKYFLVWANEKGNWAWVDANEFEPDRRGLGEY